MDKKDFLEQLSQNEMLYEAYNTFLQSNKERLGEDSQDFATFEEAYTEEFRKGMENDKADKKVLIQGDRLVIRQACIADSEFMSSVERDEDNSPWVANWPLGWRVAKFGDEDFLQVIVERKDGTPIGFIIFRDMLCKEQAVQLKRIAIIDKGKGYGKETLYLAQKMAFEIFNTKRLYLSTKEQNLRAQSIYKATGFVADMPDPCTSFHMDWEDYYRIARGNTAEVFEYEMGKVCKLFYEGYPQEYVALEFQNAKEMFHLKIKVPEPFEIISKGSRNGIIYEKIEGKTLSESMNDDHPDEVVEKFADFHRELLGHHSEKLLSYKVFLSTMVKNKAADNATIFAEIEDLPDGDCVLHGDFHFNNIMIKQDNEPVIIDFMNVCRGPVLYDVARTFFLLRLSDESIAQKYLSKMGVLREEIEKYLHIIEQCREYEG